MNLHNQKDPTPQQFKMLLKTFPENTPISMLNIIKYKGDLPQEDLTGEDLYNRYMAQVMPFLKRAEGKLIWKGRVVHTLIGDSEDQPHMMMVISYPSVMHFINMITTPEYEAVAKDRTMALEYGGLIATQQIFP